MYRTLDTVLKISGNAVAGLKSIGELNPTAEKIDITTLGDTHRKYIQGIKDSGEISVEGFFLTNDTNGQTAIRSAFDSGAETAFSIEFPSGASWSFNAIVISFGTSEATIDGTCDFTANLAISGAPTLALSASTGLTTPFFAISNGAVITPAPSGSVYEYVATVLTGIASVTVTPTATAGVITVNGNTVNSGAASSAIPLGAAGSITTVKIVVTETSKSPKTYTIRVVRAAS